MSCRFHRKVPLETVKFLGGNSVTPHEYVCILKKESDSKRRIIYQELLKRRIESLIYSDDCPVASSNKWSLCPFGEEPLD